MAKLLVWVICHEPPKHLLGVSTGVTSHQQRWPVSLHLTLALPKAMKPNDKRSGLAGNTPRADPKQDLLLLLQGKRGCRREGRHRQQQGHGWGDSAVLLG